VPQHDVYRARVESGILRSVMWSPSARKTRPIIRRAAPGEGIDVPVSVKTHQDAERPPPSGLGTAPMLLSPFLARAAHVVQLGPVRVEQRCPEPAPPSGVTSKLRVGAGVANNTLDTYESGNLLMSNCLGRALQPSMSRRCSSLCCGAFPAAPVLGQAQCNVVQSSPNRDSTQVD